MTLIQLSALALVMACSTLATAADRSGLVDDPGATNSALLVGAPNGLPGIDHDLDNAETMATDPAYHYKTERLFDDEATKANVLKGLTAGTKAAGPNGSFMFYFSGHGNQGIIAATNCPAPGSLASPSMLSSTPVWPQRSQRCSLYWVRSMLP